MIHDELYTLQMAATQEDRVAVMTAIERLDTAFERNHREHHCSDTIAALIDRRIDEAVEGAAVNEYREAILKLEERRIELDRASLAYIQEEDSSMTLVKSINSVNEAYQESKKKTAALKTVVSGVELPTVLVIWGDPDIEIPKGTTVDVELALSLLGRSHPDSIPVESESEIPTSVSSSVVKSLDENETVTVHVELSPATAGEFNVFVTATGETNADRFCFTALVLAKRDYVARASRAVGSLETILDSMGRQNQWNGMRNQTRTLRRRLKSISDDLENRHRPVRSIDNRLRAVRNGFEAMKRQVSRLGSSVERQEVLYILENIDEEIGNAIEALP